MPATSCNHTIDPHTPEGARIQEKLTEAATRIQPRQSAELLWHRLTESERRSLGDSFEDVLGKLGTAQMMMHARGYNRICATIEAAYMTDCLSRSTRDWLLLATSPNGLVVDDEIERLADKFPLVVAENPRRVYWQGEEVQVDWHAVEKPWLLVWRLAVAAKQGGVLERQQFGEQLDSNYLSKLKSRADKLNGFPPSLADTIESAGGGSLKLNLKPGEIRCFQVATQYVLLEVAPSRLPNAN